MVSLTKECSIVLHKKLLEKLKKSREPFYFFHLGNIFVTKALCDLGAPINLIPRFIFRKLDIGKIQPTTIGLQLANRSLAYPSSIVDDVLVKVDVAFIYY